ncbi:hypothetical protein JCM21714_3475 [Gracilibacillus boraciitolerans JCM 21714]|uniref:Uncharacterized protein n=1 Tax=Gracilibacillus boraciitolerans JCM 21714 TaxID=1298598 RepID=W4VNA8_9BACI|nr:hypothetical protein [Gracilibacillus boraciitolerans]GAE94328.1 hypothetical protein JCM21714_3475 [Gracilibacillus boraciitolerans JCM 21714]
MNYYYEKNSDLPNLLTYNFDDFNESTAAVECVISLNHEDIAMLLGNIKRLSGVNRFVLSSKRR